MTIATTLYKMSLPSLACEWFGAGVDAHVDVKVVLGGNRGAAHDA